MNENEYPVQLYERYQSIVREKSNKLDQDPIFKTGKFDTGGYTPQFLIESIIDILRDQHFKYILDPWARRGLLLSSLIEAGIAKKGTGICIEGNEYDFAQELGENLNITWEHADPQEWLWTHKQQYDLVICNPPWRLRSGSDRTHRKFEGVSDSDDALIILNASLHLKPGGTGIFIVPMSFIFQRHSGTVYANLKKYGLALHAFFVLPPRTFAPVTVAAGGLAIIRKSKPVPIFTGIIPQDANLRKKLITNLKEGKEDQDVIFGKFADPAQFRGVYDLERDDRINRIAKKFGYPPFPLKEIALEINRMNQGDLAFEEHENTVYLPLIGNSPAVTSTSAFKIKSHNYLQLVIDPEKADAEYIAGLLSSPVGKILREQALTGFIPKLNKKTVNDISVFLPSMNQQQELIEMDRTARAIEEDLKNIRTQIWSEPVNIKKITPKLEQLTRKESFKDWLDTLPYPLASILWMYHTSENEEEKQIRYLLHFFESTAEFLSTVHISAIITDNDLKQELLPEILQQLKKKINEPTFGTWNFIYSNLSTKIRTYTEELESREKIYRLYKIHDSEVIEMLTSKELPAILKNAKIIRNQLAHGPELGPSEIKKFHESLKGSLQTLMQIFGSKWDRYQLVSPMELVFKGGKYYQNVQKVSGTTNRFEKMNLDLDMPLDKDSLYLSGIGEREALRLLPLVLLKSSEKYTNACFFYNKLDADTFFFASHHIDDDKIIEISDLEIITPLKKVISGDIISKKG